MALKVILDTNALMLPFESGFNLQFAVQSALAGERGYSLIVPEPMLDELRRLSREGRWEAKAALKMVEEKGLSVEIMASERRGDEAILELIERLGSDDVVVFTNDRELIKRLKGLRVRFMRLRGKGHLEME